MSWGEGQEYISRESERRKILRGKKKNMKNKLIYKSLTSLVRIDTGYRDMLKVKAAKSGMTIKTLLEGYIADILVEETSGKYE